LQEFAWDYANAGFWEDAAVALQPKQDATKATPPLKPARDPMAAYEYVFFNHKWMDRGGPAKYQLAPGVDEAVLAEASSSSPDYCFPFRFESAAVLEFAIEENPRDARAHYYLGNLWYDHQPQKAIKFWEKSLSLEKSFPVVHRNLALAYAQTLKDHAAAVASMEQAVALRPGDPRYFYELDVLYEGAGTDPKKRLAMLSSHHETVSQRDDAFLRETIACNACGTPDKALELLLHRRFHNWEGSSEVYGVYVDALLMHGQGLLREKKAAEALKDFLAALEYPDNLQCGKRKNEPRLPEVCWTIGKAYEALGKAAQAREYYERCLTRREDTPSPTQYYQALALKKLGKDSEATDLFNAILQKGRTELEHGVEQDHFAKFGEKQSERVRTSESHYLVGLGNLGLGQTAEARTAFEKALSLNPAHVGARQQFNQLNQQ
jgi:tetratricopeptide (TPR) repeat protein